MPYRSPPPSFPIDYTRKMGLHGGRVFVEECLRGVSHIAKGHDWCAVAQELLQAREGHTGHHCVHRKGVASVVGRCTKDLGFLARRIPHASQRLIRLKPAGERRSVRRQPWPRHVCCQSVLKHPRDGKISYRRPGLDVPVAFMNRDAPSGQQHIGAAQPLHLAEARARIEQRREQRPPLPFVRIVVGEVGWFRAAYSAPLGWCVLTWETKRKPPQLVARIAALFVHEATHARLMRAGFGYREEERVRVERACSRAAEAFTRRLPAGGHATADMKIHLAWISPDVLTDAAERRRKRRRVLQFLKDSGAPRWIIRFIEWRNRRSERGRKVGSSPAADCTAEREN